MKNVKNKEQFIELRAEGRSYVDIAEVTPNKCEMERAKI